MVQQTQPGPPPRRRPPLRMVQVSRVERLTPRVLRVTFAGEELAGFEPHGPAEHIKVFFPPPGQDRPVRPTYDADGRPVYPPGVERPVSRTYTSRRWRPDALELDVDFVLHGEGPGASWAQRARPGDAAMVGGPGGPFRLDPEARWYVLAADACAVPAVGTILETLPSSARADVYLEVSDEAEHQQLESAAAVNVTWLHAAGGQPGALLEKTIRALRLPDGPGRVFVACEAAVMRDIRRHLLFDRGLAGEAMHTHGYWKQGVANHPDHDLGQEM